VRRVDNTNQGFQAWIIVGSAENFAKTRELGFSLVGLKSRHRKKAERMRPGDKIVWYITGAKAFAGIATITSPYFESHERVWKSGDPMKEAEDYPFRVRIELDLVPPEGEWIAAEPIARQMRYVQRYPSENWTLAFQGNVHPIERDDFELIRAAFASPREPAGVQR
jgi:hypothetical protein